MSPRLPAFDAEHGRAFDHPDVAQLYHLRRRYPLDTHEILLGLVAGPQRVVLDAGAGTGEIARALAPHVQRIDALEPSLAMIEVGKALSGGSHPNIHWIAGTAEETTLDGPYALITCGQSMHWMDWDIVYPRFRELLHPDAVLAIVEVRDAPPWADDLRTIIARYSANQHAIVRLAKIDLLEEEKRGLFRRTGERRTAPVTVRQPVADYIASHHAMSGLATHRIGAKRSAAFDAEVRELLRPCGPIVEFEVAGQVIWGRPA